MRAQAREPFRCYFNYEVREFNQGDVLEGELAAYALGTGCPVDDLDAEPPADPRAGELDITAPAPAVLAWVGDDPERAAQALAAEQATEKPRAGLTGQLQKMLPPAA